MSDANRTAIRVSRENTPKTPFGTPLMQPIRMLSAALAYTPETVTSSEIDPLRQIADNPLVGFTSGGDLPTEFSIGNTDALLPGLMMSEWVRTPEVINGASWKYGFGSGAVTRVTAISATAITLASNAVLAGTAVNSSGTSFSPGQLADVQIPGSPDQLLRISASTSTSLTVAGATAVASPPAGTRVKAIGFEGAAGDVASTQTGGNALTSTALNFTQMNLSIGQWVYIGGRGTTYGFAAFGGWARVSGITATRLSFDMVPTGFTADTATGKTVRVFYTDFIKNGVIENISYYIEEEFGITAGTRYLYHRGQEVNSRVISADTKAIITDTWNFMGMDALPVTATRQTGATTLTPGTGTVLNSSTAIPVFYENGSPVGSPNFVNSFSISVENNKRSRDAIGVLGAADIGSGRLSVTGNLSTYFGDETLYNKVISNTISSLTVGFMDTAMSIGELWDVPRLKYSSGAPEVTGIDTDVMVPLAYQGLRDVAGGRDYTVSCSRIEYFA